jgi:ankyrin repeat protein
MLAAWNNSEPGVISRLLGGGAEIDEKDHGGCTALMRAANFNPNPDALLTLLDAGADPQIKNKKGKRAIDFAVKKRRLKDTEALKRIEEASGV